MSKTLGSGACGVVFLVYNVKTCCQYAIKHVQKNKFASKSKRTTKTTENERVMNEVKIMKYLNHVSYIIIQSFTKFLYI